MTKERNEEGKKKRKKERRYKESFLCKLEFKATLYDCKFKLRKKNTKKGKKRKKVFYHISDSTSRMFQFLSASATISINNMQVMYCTIANASLNNYEKENKSLHLLINNYANILLFS